MKSCIMINDCHIIKLFIVRTNGALDKQLRIPKGYANEVQFGNR